MQFTLNSNNMNKIIVIFIFDTKEDIFSQMCSQIND